MAQKQGRLVVLNGTSSSGKTSTAESLAELLGPACIITGLDDILGRVQPFGSESPKAVGRLLRTLRVLWFQLTDGRLRLFRQLHREVIVYVQSNHDVILETALMDPRARRDAAECFAPLNGFFIAMKPPLFVSEQWEAGRDDRPQGQARKHFDLVHARDTYDLILDPSQMTPQSCAEAILQRLAGSSPVAFRRLLDQ